MDSMDFDVLAAARRWQREGLGLALCTVVRTWGSAPRPIGSLLALGADGRLAGSVSGGCIEDDLVLRMRAGEFAGGLPRVVTYGVSAEEAFRFGLPCGGTVELVIEPIGARAGLDDLLAAIERDRTVVRRLDMHTGAVTLAARGAAPEVLFDGKTLQTIHGSHDRLLVIGAGQLSRYLVSMALPLGYRVTVCDPREEYSHEWTEPGVELSRMMPDDLVVAMAPDAHTAVVALTHDPKLDDLALLEALKSDAFYVGAIGSRANQARRCERLALFDLTAAQIARLHGPVGLDIGARTPPEIAVSIVAEMIAARRGKEARRTVEPLTAGSS